MYDNGCSDFVRTISHYILKEGQALRALVLKQLLAHATLGTALRMNSLALHHSIPFCVGGSRSAIEAGSKLVHMYRFQPGTWYEEERRCPESGNPASLNLRDQPWATHSTSCENRKGTKCVCALYSNVPGAPDVPIHRFILPDSSGPVSNII